MKIVLFCHSLISDWNHGNAHFLRGYVRDLRSRGHRVELWESRDAWSLSNLLADHGEEPIWKFHRAYPGLCTNRYDPAAVDLERIVDDADVVIVHEWNEPELISRIGRLRASNGGRWKLLFHDTHHRSVTAPEELARFDLREYDGVLAFGEAIAEEYRRNGWTSKVWVWHEAADTALFRPMEGVAIERDLVWIGNWGDDERTAELHGFLIEPARELKLRTDVWGVRYPDEAVEALEEAGIDYHGWVPNFEVPRLFAGSLFTVHVPRRAYATQLRGIPTIRPFEAMACGIPLISAPWEDSEGLFTAGKDYLVARDGEAMKKQMAALRDDAELRAEIGRSGFECIRARHTCAHRVDELLGIIRSLQKPPARSAPPVEAPEAMIAQERPR